MTKVTVSHPGTKNVKVETPGKDHVVVGGVKVSVDTKNALRLTNAAYVTANAAFDYANVYYNPSCFDAQYQSPLLPALQPMLPMIKQHSAINAG